MTIESAQSIVREFNRLHPVGSPCWVIRADGSAFQGSTNCSRLCFSVNSRRSSQFSAINYLAALIRQSSSTYLMEV